MGEAELRGLQGARGGGASLEGDKVSEENQWMLGSGKQMPSPRRDPWSAVALACSGEDVPIPGWANSLLIGSYCCPGMNSHHPRAQLHL